MSNSYNPEKARIARKRRREKRVQDGLCGECGKPAIEGFKSCEQHRKGAGYLAEWKKKNPEKVAAYSRSYKENHREAVAARQRRWMAANPEKVKETGRKQAAKRRRDKPEVVRAQVLGYREKYRLEQDRIAGRPRPERCEICHDNEFKIVWDHCHKEGHFRGWICDRCNRVLGIVRDNRQILLNMAAYLKENKYGKTDVGREEGPLLQLIRAAGA